MDTLSETVQALAAHVFSTQREDVATAAQLARIESMLLQLMPSAEASRRPWALNGASPAIDAAAFFGMDESDSSAMAPTEEAPADEGEASEETLLRIRLARERAKVQQVPSSGSTLAPSVVRQATLTPSTTAPAGTLTTRASAEGGVSEGRLEESYEAEAFEEYDDDDGEEEEEELIDEYDELYGRGGGGDEPVVELDEAIDEETTVEDEPMPFEEENIAADAEEEVVVTGEAAVRDDVAWDKPSQKPAAAEPEAAAASVDGGARPALALSTEVEEGRYYEVGPREMEAARLAAEAERAAVAAAEAAARAAAAAKAAMAMVSKVQAPAAATNVGSSGAGSGEGATCHARAAGLRSSAQQRANVREGREGREMAARGRSALPGASLSSGAISAQQAMEPPHTHPRPASAATLSASSLPPAPTTVSRRSRGSVTTPTEPPAVGRQHRAARAPTPPQQHQARPHAATPREAGAVLPKKPSWDARSPQNERGIPDYAAEVDPHLIGYFANRGLSLMQYLLTTRTRRRHMRTELRSERETQAMRSKRSAIEFDVLGGSPGTAPRDAPQAPIDAAAPLGTGKRREPVLLVDGGVTCT